MERRDAVKNPLKLCLVGDLAGIGDDGLDRRLARSCQSAAASFVTAAARRASYPARSAIASTATVTARTTISSWPGAISTP